MADTKPRGNSIQFEWQIEKDVTKCSCTCIEAGVYCGTIRVADGAPPIEGSCGTHCWHLGYYKNGNREMFISKGLFVCGGPDAPPTPDPIAWVEFPTLTDANTDGVVSCQRRATSLTFIENKIQENIWMLQQSARTTANGIKINLPCNISCGGFCWNPGGIFPLQGQCYKNVNPNSHAYPGYGKCACMVNDDPRLTVTPGMTSDWIPNPEHGNETWIPTWIF